MTEDVRCDGVTPGGRRCRYPARTCRYHGEPCGMPTKKGTPCRRSRRSCEWHQPRCGHDTAAGPCMYFPGACPDHGDLQPVLERTCPECGVVIPLRSRTTRGAYCSPVCEYRGLTLAA